MILKKFQKSAFSEIIIVLKIQDFYEEIPANHRIYETGKVSLKSLENTKNTKRV